LKPSRERVIRYPLKEAKVITILLVILVLMLIGSAPAWPYSRGWGYAPSGTLGVVLIVLLLLALSGRI
jgi:Protein of unknown function (DUF3309)